MHIKIKGILRVVTLGGITTVFCVLTPLTTHASEQENTPPASITSTTQRIHGGGKKELDCDMSRMIITRDDLANSVKINELVNLPAAGLVYPSAKRIINQERPVLPVAHLLKSYPDAKSLVFKSCESEEELTVSANVITEDSRLYMITLNRMGRARLAKFGQLGKSHKYITVVKNLNVIQVVSGHD